MMILHCLSCRLWQRWLLLMTCQRWSGCPPTRSAPASRRLQARHQQQRRRQQSWPAGATASRACQLLLLQQARSMQSNSRR